jgi:HK97 family phage prohead protease
MKLEKRIFDLEGLRIERRKGEDGTTEQTLLRGHAAVFNKWSVDLGGFREKIEPGAFKRAVKEDDVLALWNHNSDLVLGRTASKTLKLSEDDDGLAIRVELPQTALVRDMVIGPIERGDVSQMSFAFKTRKDSWEEFPDEPDRLTERTLLDVALSDVSPVTYPAYPDTDVAVAMRSLERWRDEHPSEDLRSGLWYYERRQALLEARIGVG